MSHGKKAVEPPSSSEGVQPLTPKLPTKYDSVLTLLRRDMGATLAELVEATNWQPHTTRAMLTGLRKKGHAIERIKRDGASCYFLSIPEA